jgi:hypothetical protein
VRAIDVGAGNVHSAELLKGDFAAEIGAIMKESGLKSALVISHLPFDADKRAGSAVSLEPVADIVLSASESEPRRVVISRLSLSTETAAR